MNDMQPRNRSVRAETDEQDLNVSLSAEATQSQNLTDQEIIDRLKERNQLGHYKGAIIFENIDGEPHVHIGNPYDDVPRLVTFPTMATEEDIQKIRSSMVWMPETCALFSDLAKAKDSGQIILVEAESALGKTFTGTKFTEFLYGLGNGPIECTCNGQTDTSALMGTYSPNYSGMSATEQKRWTELLESDVGASALSSAIREADQTEGLSGDLRIAHIKGKVEGIAKSFGLSSTQQWVKQLGAVGKAMVAKVEQDGSYSYPLDGSGHGMPLMIDEVGTAENEVSNALLKLRGHARRAKRELVFEELDNLRIKAGDGYFIMMFTNPPEGEAYEARNPLDGALLRGVKVVVYGDLSEFSYKMAAEAFLAFEAGNAPETTPRRCVLKFHEHSELRRELSEVLALFHMSYKEGLKTGEPDREEIILATLDNLAEFSDHLLRYQSRDDSGQWNVCTDIKQAIEEAYISRHIDDDFKERLENMLTSLLESDTLGKEFRGEVRPRSEIIEMLVKEASIDPAERNRQAELELEAARKDANTSDLDDGMRDLLGM